MATTDTEHYLRLHLLNVEGGGPVLRELVNVVQRSSAKGSLFDYLQCFKTHIATHKHALGGQTYYEHLFPHDGNVDISQWDITLLCFVVIAVCTLEGKLIIDLKKMFLQEINSRPEHQKTLDRFLSNEKHRIDALKGTTISDEQYDKLFPSSGAPLALEKWDDDLLTGVLSCTNSLSKVSDKLKECIKREAEVYDRSGDLDDFLASSKSKNTLEHLRKSGKLTEAQLKQVYPQVAGANNVTGKTNIDAWDYTVLCMVALNVTETLTNTTVDAVKVIRQSRNTISHGRDINYEDFLRIWSDLFDAINTILANEVPKIKSEVMERIDKFKRGPLDITWAFQVLKDWYHNDKSVNESTLLKLQKIEESTISGLLITEQNIKDHVDTKIEEVLKQLTERSRSGYAVTIEELRVKLTILCDDKETGTLIQNFIIEAAKAAKEGPVVDSDHPIIDAINTFITFMQHKASVNDARDGSVIDKPLFQDRLEELELSEEITEKSGKKGKRETSPEFPTSTSLQDAMDVEDYKPLTDKDDKFSRQKHDNDVIDNDRLQTFCRQHGRKCATLQTMCDEVIQRLLSHSTAFKHVWAAYRLSNKDHIVFVVIIEDKQSIDVPFDYPLSTFEIVYREVGFFSQENKYVLESLEDEETFRFTDDEHSQLTATLQAYSTDLMKSHKNINVISPCFVKSKDYGKNTATLENEACIVLFVHIKGLIPLDEDEFPLTLGEFRSDVREGAFQFYHNEHHPKLKMGCFIGSLTDAGTLGAFVDLPNNELGCITSAHAIVKIDDVRNLGRRQVYDSDHEHCKIYQPAPFSSEPSDQFRIGHVIKAVYTEGDSIHSGVEVVLVHITNKERHPDNGGFPDLDNNYEDNGFPAVCPPIYRSGKIYSEITPKLRISTIYKYGAKTGLTRGAFSIQGSTISLDKMYLDENKTCVLYNQMEAKSIGIQTFAEKGDSGALVFVPHEGDTDDLRAIGIVTGGLSDGTKFYITPIHAILKALDLQPRLKEFPRQVLPLSSVGPSDPRPGSSADEDEYERDESLGKTHEEISRIRTEMTGNTLKLNLQPRMRKFPSRVLPRSNVGQSAPQPGYSVGLDEREDDYTRDESLGKSNEEISRIRTEMISNKLELKSDISKLTEKVDKNNTQVTDKLDKLLELIQKGYSSNSHTSGNTCRDDKL